MLIIVIVSAIGVTSVILLIYVLIMRSARGAKSEAFQEEAYQRLEDENRRLADEPPVLSAEGDSRLTQQLEPALKSNESVTPFPSTATERSRCPACDGIITATDESCPSCEISFVTDGSQNWTPRTVGPADGIYLPPNEFSE